MNRRTIVLGLALFLAAAACGLVGMPLLMLAAVVGLVAPETAVSVARGLQGMAMTGISGIVLITITIWKSLQ